jgi:hypothetical protein
MRRAKVVPVGGSAPVINGGSGDALQQGEATGEVRGELNRMGRLQRRHSPRRRCRRQQHSGWLDADKRQGGGGAVARAMPKKNKRRGENDGDGAAPLLNKYDRWRTAGRGCHAAAWSGRMAWGHRRDGRAVWGGRHRLGAGRCGRAVPPDAKQGWWGGCLVGSGHSSGRRRLSLI